MKYAASFIPKTLLARIALAVFVLALGMAAIVLFFVPSPEKRMAQALEAKLPLTNDQKNLLADRLDAMSGDTDNDGLKDWEELIYKTDPKNPDTDKDGTSDGDEITQDRNPLVRAKNDSLQATSEVTVNDPSFDENGYTATIVSALLSDPSFLKILAGGTGNLTEEEARQIAQQFMDSSDFSAIDAVDEAALYAKVVPSDDTGPAAIKKYFNALGEIYATYLFVTPEEDSFAIIADAIKNNDISKLAVLTDHKKKVGDAAAELEKLSPPMNVADFHKKEIVVLEKLVKQLAALADAERDPVAVMVVLPRYIKLRQDAGTLRTDMQDWLASHTIHFTEQEPGSFFNKS